MVTQTKKEHIVHEKGAQYSGHEQLLSQSHANPFGGLDACFSHSNHQTKHMDNYNTQDAL